MSARLFTSILALIAILQIVESTNLYPKSCLQAKQFQLTNGHTNGHTNGYYLLYDDLQRPFTTYCDFKSDPGFAWTLIESLSLSNGKSTKYRKSFNHDVPSLACTPNWLEYRLSASRMKSIKNTPGSTHYRATCNFNIESENGGIDHRDYMRVAFCADSHFFHGTRKNYCTRIEYINVRGHTCRQCNIAIWDGANDSHKVINLTDASKLCNKWIVPNAISHEQVFGHYYNVNPKFSCGNSSSSTTNWWIGGYY